MLTVASGRRSIPAHAGEPGPGKGRDLLAKVYPRTCGGTRLRAVKREACHGLSPHMRGNRRGASGRSLCTRSIPAHAGEPRSGPGGNSSIQVYPRTCGGTEGLQDHARHQGGLSPHMRGNLDAQDVLDPIERSIPAHAGEPAWRSAHRSARAVYPRTCGGTTVKYSVQQFSGGLSPHMRGNLL